MDKKWFEMTEGELEEKLSTSVVNGLTKKGAATARRKAGANIVFRLPHGSFASYLKDILSDSSSVILIFAVLIASIFENTVSAYVIAGIMVINCFACVFTYVKAHRVLEGMGEYSLPGAKVVRGGHLYLVSMNSLVPGDLICLKAGDIVPADARVISAENFYVSEKGVTDNTDAVRKSPQGAMVENMNNENMFNMLFATSVVLKGSARAIVVETGANTLAARNNSGELDFDHDSLDVFVMLKKYGSKISMLMLAMVFVIMFIEIVTGLNTRGLYEIFLGGMALAVAAMTEFYTAFGYIVVACGLFGARTYKRKTGNNSVILKNINSIERLREINCIIFKKDGILTERNKTVDAMYSNGQIFRVKDYDKADPDFTDLVEAAVITTGHYMRNALVGQGNERRIPSPDEEAIIECAKRYGLYNIGLDTKYPLVRHKNAIGAVAYDYSVVKKGGKLYAYLRGEAKLIVNMCSHYSVVDTSIEIDSKIKTELMNVIGEYEKINTGVLAFAVCEITPTQLEAGPLALIKRRDMTLVGYMALKAPLFENCALTIERLSGAGIKLVVNSPSASGEDLAAAKSLGICKSDSEILTEAIIENMSDEALAASISGYSVYAGLKNSSIRRAISALKENQNNVAFCAGSLSDISVLERADIGYTHAELPDTKKKQGELSTSERESCSDALKFKADVIIPGTGKRGVGGILAIEKSILTSKLIYRNLMNLFAYMASVQFARLFIVLYSVFTKNDLLSPIQILVSGLVFDFLAVLSIAFSKPSARTLDDYEYAKLEMKNLPRFVLRNALFGVFWAAMTIFVPMIINLTGARLTGVALVSSSFVSFTAVQMFTLAEVKRRESIFIPSSFAINPMFVLTCVSAAV
ncbi:MAG: cation-transporting P-type ATPase, partial [Clostridia bacterium]|nr:cation-transporting P-type ATPase [Clostridia bacterium]